MTNNAHGQRDRASSDTQRQADRHGGVRRAARGLAGLSARLPLRDDPRRRPPGVGDTTKGPGVAAAPLSTASGSRLTDEEALERTQAIPRGRARMCETQEFAFASAAGAARMRAIRPLADMTTSLQSRTMIQWPRGVEAGVVQGIPCRHLRRRGQPCGEVASDHEQGPGDHRLDLLVSSGTRLPLCRSRTGAARTAAGTVRLRGGSGEKLRFFHTVDPAITRKRDIEDDRSEESGEAEASRRSNRLGAATASTTSPLGRVTSSPTAL